MLVTRGGGAGPSLLRRARERAWEESGDTLIQQIPHWMFTFTGSGTELLARTLAMITSRPHTYEKVRREITAAGSLDDAETIGRLAYVEACLLETGRLFPPVRLTFHCAVRDQRVAGSSIPAGAEIVQHLPLLHRRAKGDPSEDSFRPESWLAGSPGYSNLFLRGARACPGRDLILFVCKSAIALQLGVYGVMGGAPALRDDPLPLSFPRDGIRLHTTIKVANDTRRVSLQMECAARAKIQCGVGILWGGLAAAVADDRFPRYALRPAAWGDGVGRGLAHRRAADQPESRGDCDHR